jgi:hypothetical protein
MAAVIAARGLFASISAFIEVAFAISTGATT